MAKKIPIFKPFDSIDFSAFEDHKKRDSFYNEARLRVKRKLAILGKHIENALPDDLKLKHRTSLSHPYQFNGFCVSSQWVYFARSEKDRKALKKHLGSLLGKDLDPNYIHVLLMVEINLTGITVALRVHQKAWWDGENLKKKCKIEKNLQEFTNLLNQLNGFALSIHNWKKQYSCGDLSNSDLTNYFKYYTPGEHWLNLSLFLEKKDLITTSSEALVWVIQNISELLSLYSFIAWSPENNFLFSEI